MRIDDLTDPRVIHNLELIGIFTQTDDWENLQSILTLCDLAGGERIQLNLGWNVHSGWRAEAYLEYHEDGICGGLIGFGRTAAEAVRSMFENAKSRKEISVSWASPTDFRWVWNSVQKKFVTTR